MSKVPSRAARGGVRGVAPSPAVAGFRPAAIALAVAFALQPAARAQSQYTGAASGGATVTSTGSHTEVTTTNGAGHRSVLNWKTLGVPYNTSMHFQQPDAVSTSINRVNGGQLTEIYGKLSSNGRLVLVNPAGIAIGQGAMIDTAAFTASTLALDEADAVAGRLRFGGGTGSLTIEDASILAKEGDVVLIGSRVQAGAQAVIQAQGATILAAGNAVELTGRGLEGIHMSVQAGNEAVNLGTLKGDAVGIFAGTLRHSGLVQATAVSTEGGKVVLKANGGDALVDGRVVAHGAGGKGGGIDVLGRRVALLAGASLDASGASGGGSIRVGGDYQGRNAGVPNAEQTSVDAQATIKADATQQGDGGRVIVWSDGTTRMDGRISARGGAQGGDGGFAEVSGRQRLEYTGRADLRAPQGRTGTLLLDPNDVEIVLTAGTDTAVTYILESTLESQLTTASVIVQAGIGTANATAGNITVASGVNVQWNNDNVLGLQADAGVNLLGSISGTGTSSAVSIQALGAGVTQNSASAITAFGLKVNAAGNVNLSGTNQVQRLSGNTTLNGANGNFTFRNGRSLHLAQVTTPYGGTYDGINAGTGNVQLSVDGGGTLTQAATSAITANDLGVYTNGDVTLTGNNMVNSLQGTSSLLGAPGNFTFRNGRDLLVTQLSANGGNVDVRTTAGSITLGATPTVTPPPAVQGNNVTIQAQQNVVIQRDVNAGGTAFIQAVNGTIDQLGSATVNAALITMQAASNVTLPGTLRARGGISVTSDNGSISFNQLDASGESDLDTINAGNVTLKARGNISGNIIQAQGGYYYGTVGDQAGNGAAVSVTSDNGSITIADISASAGEGDGWGVGGASAGSVTLKTNSLSGGNGNIDVQVIEANGNSGTTATDGGIVNVTATNGSVWLEEVVADGGHATGENATGGKGGKISVTASGDIHLWTLQADGGASETGDGGQGGEIRLGTGGSLLQIPPPVLALAAPSPTTSMFYVSAVGGQGGADSGTGNGKTGGLGGLIEVSRTGGDLVADATWLLDAGGGAGGDAVSEIGGTTGGTGGNGGQIKLHAPSGRVVLASPLLHAAGGVGGMNADESDATSGVNGTLRAMGTSVDVTSDFILMADWINDSIVKVMGSSQVYGAGLFQNNSDVQLFDTAGLNAAYGVVNAGRFTSFGSANTANLTLNTTTGMVEVVAGSTLSTPAFLFNQGKVRVDGTLRTADAPPVLVDGPVLLAAATGPVFTNDTTGKLTGNGTLVVGSGAGTVQNLGTIAPGDLGAVGTLTLDAHLVMEAGSTYAADLLNTGSHDRLVVTGGATSGGSIAANYLPGTTFAAGDSFRVLQSSTLDPAALPTVNKPELAAQASGNDLLLVANAAFPVAPPPPPPAPAPNADLQNAQQQANNQVATFAELFVAMSEEQDRENRIGKDDIVITETACTR